MFYKLLIWVNKNLRPKALILVGPWIDPNNDYLKKFNPDTTFFDFEIDQDLCDRTSVEVIYSTDDETGVIQSVEGIQKSLPEIVLHTFSDKGHFTEPDLGQKECPEILQVIMNVLD